jgi:acyl dehydratase
MTEPVLGAVLEPFVIECVDSQRMKTMAALLQDPNPIHFDVEVVRALGYGEQPVNQGPINMAWFMECAIRFAGGRERLLRTQIRFLGNVFAGERFVAQGTVTAVDAHAGTAELSIECSCGGRPVLAGSATVAITQ